MSGLTVVSLFDGIGGFPLAFERAGAKTVATVEIDTAAAAISRRHFPHAAQFDDVTKVTGDDLRAVGFVPERGIVTAGWPCQDFSVAGRRAGLDGARSGLWWEVARILAELRPAWFVGENVPGLLSSVCEPECPGGCMAGHGGAFGAVIGSLGQLGYGVAYRVLDAQHFGVPQRRERVFIVGHLGEPWSAPAQVLLEPESSDRDSTTGGTAGTETAGIAASGVGNASPAVMVYAPPVSPTLVGGSHNPASHGKQNGSDRGALVVESVVSALTANGVGTCGADDNQAQAGHLIPTTVMGGVTHTLTSEGADASEDGTGRGTPIVAYAPDVAAPLTRGSAASPGGYDTVVRRLTELECERLQGYPDGWTDGQSGSARYRQLGNSVAVPVVEWIARRLIGIDDEVTSSTAVGLWRLLRHQTPHPTEPTRSVDYGQLRAMWPPDGGFE